MSETQFNRIRAVANYQFDADIGRELFPDEAEIVLSKKTERIRHIYLDGRLLATFRPRDGLFSLTLEGARRLNSLLMQPRFRVSVRGDVGEFIEKGGNVFAKHVVEADPEIRPGEEVIVLGEGGRVLAVGRAMLTGREMLAFKRGIAVKVRRGAGEKEEDEE